MSKKLLFVICVLITLLVIDSYCLVDLFQVNTKLKDQIELLEADIEYYQIVIRGFEEANTFVARVSAYTARPQETNTDPQNTSVMQKPVPGWTVAINRSFGQWKGRLIYIEHPQYGGVRYVNDYMNQRYDTNEIDILVHTPSEAFSFGIQEAKVYLIEPYVPFDKELYCAPNPSIR